MQFLITDELDKRAGCLIGIIQSGGKEEKQLFQLCRANGAYRHNLEHLREALVSDWTNILWGSTGPLRISNAIFGCPFFHLQFSTMFNFSLLQIFLFLQNQHGIRVLEVFPAARGAPGCSRGWESDFCQLQTLQLRICKIWESGSAATPLFMLVRFK